MHVAFNLKILILCIAAVGGVGGVGWGEVRTGIRFFMFDNLHSVHPFLKTELTHNGVKIYVYIPVYQQTV